MTRHFQNEIERLKKKILRMAAMAEESVQKSVRAAAERNAVLAEEVIRFDLEIDMREIEVEEECLKILALHQPVAADLRYIVAVLKINNDLERIADLATNIAKRSRDLAGINDRRTPFDLDTLLKLTLAMVRSSVDALVNQDVDRAQQVRCDDDRIDELHETAYETVTREITNNPERTVYLLNLLSISRNLERIADHATNIAEDVIYMIEGEIVRHQWVAGRS